MIIWRKAWSDEGMQQGWGGGGDSRWRQGKYGPRKAFLEGHLSRDLSENEPSQ